MKNPILVVKHNQQDVAASSGSTVKCPSNDIIMVMVNDETDTLFVNV